MRFLPLPLSLSVLVSCSVWLCGRLISINVETNPKSENRIRMGALQIKIVCLFFDRYTLQRCFPNWECGLCVGHNFDTYHFRFYDLTILRCIHSAGERGYCISSGRLTTFRVDYLRVEFLVFKLGQFPAPDSPG